MKPAIIGGIVILAIIAIIASYFALRKSDASPVTGPVTSPEKESPSGTTGVGNVVDDQVDIIVTSIKEGYVRRVEYMTNAEGANSDAGDKEKIAKLVEILLSNGMTKPVTALTGRDDVSGRLKLILDGADLGSVQPILDRIGTCVSDKISKVDASKGRSETMRTLQREIYECADNELSNGTEFQDVVVPFMETVGRNIVTNFGTQSEKESFDDRVKKSKCALDIYTNPEHNKLVVQPSDPRIDTLCRDEPQITWNGLKEFGEAVTKK